MNRIIEIAQAEIGYKEGERKDNKYGQWFGFNNVAWCMMFCCWVYDKNSTPIKGDWKKGFASVPLALKHFTASNELTHYPQAGDLVIFDWQRDGKPDHVGLFVKDLGNGTFETIEGNTSDGNPSNGGCVERKIRKYTQVEAFIHPKILDNQTT